MTDSTPPEDGEPTTFREKAKDWAEKHPRTILFAKAAGTVVGVVTVAVLAQHNRAEDADEYPNHAEGLADAEGVRDAEDIAEQEQPSASDRASGPRDSAKNHLRNLHPGWNASEEKKAQYKEETGEDLPSGTTWVSPKPDLDDSSEDEAPDEAAA
ncbi:hypothetical protein AB0B01_18425 [Streptomyces sp. NPDC044571]|uniref:hypothetical protein n=1 Tax=Streptomyces sp. NPDC044571 TaxID=3155371 RepID=UPI0033F78A55